MTKYIFAISTILTIASCAKKTVSTITQSTTTITSTTTPKVEKPPVKIQLDGQVLYMENCSRCHGETGKASGQAPALDKPIGKYQMVSIINSGAGSMPRFAEKLSSDEINAIADFVMKLSVSSK